MSGRSMWVANCQGFFQCGGARVPCGYPPGLPFYNCSCGQSCEGSQRRAGQWRPTITKRDCYGPNVVGGAALVASSAVLPNVTALPASPAAPFMPYPVYDALLLRLATFHRAPISCPVYYIGLETSIDRRIAFEREAAGLNVHVRRVDAIRGRDFAQNRLTAGAVTGNFSVAGRTLVFRNYYHNQSSGELGCTLSHFKAIYMAYVNGDDVALIVEDDASLMLAPHWPFSLDELMRQAPPLWRVLQLFSRSASCSSPSGAPLAFRPFSCSRGKWCVDTVAYVMNREGMAHVLRDVLSHGVLILDPHVDYGSRTECIRLQSGNADMLIYQRAGEMHTVSVPFLVPRIHATSTIRPGPSSHSSLSPGETLFRTVERQPRTGTTTSMLTPVESLSPTWQPAWANRAKSSRDANS